ncbi:glucose dehydrogenase [FAD, quinone] isoform X2 [Hyalella azteca]|uniref:Glucose dehydrogenase [FAD, quinone] isoform X1 n=1 Tax=Hyalella azteca TaxID=294128 RepID=A0A8B7NLS8_HYAAZ|nr:glucose dehydrogenase [FAD, quinone] isoform X1 [Hyalella azteca]XP_018014613.1 glucose dehydrogenase [FAD, quinone] isoform X2 [Hyalella azteca]
MSSLSVMSLITKLAAIIAGIFTQPTVYPTSVMPQDTIVDFIVVGAGSAGSVVAGRLSEVPEWEVLVLEAGGQPPTFTKIPFLHFASAFPNVSFVNKYPTIAPKYSSQFGVLTDPRYTTGKMVGGSGAINQMVHNRGNPQDYDNWAQLGNPGWDWETVLKYFKKSEDYRSPMKPRDAPFRGIGGPMSVQKLGWMPPVGRLAIQAGMEVGLPEIDYNTDTKIGSTILQLATRNGERESSADAFLMPNMQRKNLKLQINSQVIKIILNKNNDAIGVKYVHKNKVKRVFARREVIISAGGADTPKLLMLSGIGPREQLRKLGIDTRVDLPGVGQNYQDHVSLRGIGWTIHPNISSSLLEQISPSAMLRYQRSRDGPLSVPVGMCASYLLNVHNPDEPTVPDIQVFLFCALDGQDYGLFSLSGYQESVQEYYRPTLGRDGFFMLPMLSRPKSVGTVTLKSRNPFDPPVLDHNSLSHPDDVELMVKAAKASLKLGNAKIFRRALGAEPLKKPIPGCAHLEFQSDDYWRCFVRGMANVMAHISGTCKMAPDSDPMGVVTPRLIVRGVRNLRIMDASIMPQIVSGNTNAPVIMIGERGADLIKEDYGKIKL